MTSLSKNVQTQNIRPSQRLHKYVQSLVLHICHHSNSLYNGLVFGFPAHPLAQFPVIILQRAEVILTGLYISVREKINRVRVFSPKFVCPFQTSCSLLHHVCTNQSFQGGCIRCLFSPLVHREINFPAQRTQFTGSGQGIGCVLMLGVKMVVESLFAPGH